MEKESQEKKLRREKQDYDRAILSGAQKSARLQRVEVVLTPLVLTTRGWSRPASVDLDIQARINSAQAGDWLVVLTPDRHHARPGR